jgi:hypothetical protein
LQVLERNSIKVSGASDRVGDVVTCSDRTMVGTLPPRRFTASETEGVSHRQQ